MATPLRQNALTLHKTLSERVFWEFPIKWDPQAIQFSYTKNTRRQLVCFFLGEFLIIFVGVGCSCFLIVKQRFYPNPDVSLLHIFIFLISMIGSSLKGLWSMFAYTNGNYCISIYEEISKIEKSFIHKESNMYNVKSTKKTDMAGISLNALALTPILSLLILLLLVLFRVDPLAFIFDLIFIDSNRNLNTVLFLTRIVLQTHLFSAACRGITFGTILINIVQLIGEKCNKEFKNLRAPKNSSFFRNFPTFFTE